MTGSPLLRLLGLTPLPLEGLAGEIILVGWAVAAVKELSSPQGHRYTINVLCSAKQNVLG